MAGKKAQKPLSFEEGVKRLKEITSVLEAGTLPLNEGIALYKEGAALSAACRAQLEKAENEVKLYAEGMKTVAFDARERDPADED